MQPKFAEKPRVRIGVVSVYMGLKREKYFIGHTWSPYFSETRGRPYAYECYQILQSKNMECKKPSTCNRNCSEERVSRNPHKHFWLWGNFWLRISQEKYCKKVLQRWAWEIELIACYITVRIPPNSLISPGCCILQECVRLRGYIREWGPPHFSLFALFQCRQNIYVIGDGNNACILVRNSYTKGLTKCYTDSGHTFRQIL